MTGSDHRMSLEEAVGALHAARSAQDIVITTMAPPRVWMQLGAAAHDLVLVPSAMGHATSFGLGLALAQPTRRVIVCNGDGSMLMNLGSLVTIGGMAPRNLLHVVCQNGVYEVTGGQPIPGVERLDFGQIALGAGFRRAESFDDLAALERALPELLAAEGPTFVTLKLRPFSWGDGPRRRTLDAVRELTEALGSGP